MRIPQTPLKVTVIEALSVGVGLRLIVDPSIPVAVGLLALAGAWALEKIFVTEVRLRQTSVAAAEAAAREAHASVETMISTISGLESRLVRIETREGWRTDGRERR
jgi:metal-sulfur cluster biosynthetic enzyme